MDASELERLARVEERAKGNTRRIEALEKQTQALTDLTAAVKVMTTKQDAMSVQLGGIDKKVSILEGKPAKRWEEITGKVVWAVLSALIALALAKGGFV